MRRYPGSLLFAGVVLALSGCGSATNNGLSPQAENTYPVPSAIPTPPIYKASAHEVPPTEEQVPAQSLPAVSAPVVPPSAGSALPGVNYSSTALPLTPLASSASAIRSATQSVSQAAPQTLASAKNSADQAESQAQNMVQQKLGTATSVFSGKWQADMRKARQDSAQCAALSSSAQSSCWQKVSYWAKSREAQYQTMSSTATGAEAQQMQSAAKFFGVTSEWASACSSLSAQSCAESPLISKMQQWKASVGISGR
ncbi:hypothetical protein B1757_03220 [Acidithiobacillus marinus]|uniref:Lipoprotein n=1 Tax=Acidithiobacillus marinus TaxID=187490 RepID=A0A2I1DP60_9PROT|nr:hypothetical protein [Acidithiobacillus marinus]PKY11646.1 hypothetical protein B1757_03220 [Acidithiobacillus marinus]